MPLCFICRVNKGILREVSLTTAVAYVCEECFEKVKVD